MSNIYNMADTWNDSGAVWTAIKMNVTASAYDAASLLMDLQKDGVSKFSVGILGAVVGASLALGGATIGSNALAVTGTVALNAKGTFTNVAVTGNYPPDAASETLLTASLSGGNILALQNTHASGYSAWTARGNDGYEYFAGGYGNPNSATIFAGRTYLETWSGRAGQVAGFTSPREFVFTADGDYGRTGTVNNVRFHQRYTINHLGTRFWKGVPYNDGSEQVPIAEFNEGGHFAILNKAEPQAIDVPNSGIAFWFDDTATSPDLRFKSRDSAGALYSGSVAISSAVSATVADAFTAGDSASALTGGRTPDTGSAWASADSDNWGISSNKAYRSNGSADSYAYIDSGLTAACVECDITLSSVRANAGIVISGVDASNYVYVALHRDGAVNKIQCYVVASGAFTELTVFTGYTVAGLLSLNTTYAVRVGRSGNSIFAYLNGVLKGRWETSSHASATKQGIWSYQFGSSEDDLGSRWDNFKVFA